MSIRKIFLTPLLAHCAFWGVFHGAIPTASTLAGGIGCSAPCPAGGSVPPLAPFLGTNSEQTADRSPLGAPASGWLSGVSLINGCEDLPMFSCVLKFTAYRTFAAGKEWYEGDFSMELGELSFVTGLAGALDGASSRTTFGGFFEGAFAATHAGDDGPTGGSRTRTLGVGAFGSIEFRQMGLGRPQLEGAFRVGALHNSWEGEGSMKEYSFRGSVPYLAIRLGSHYGWRWREKFPVYLYGKYFWTHPTGKNFPKSEISFRAINSHRIRLGGRFSVRSPDRLVPWFDAYYEREMAATARGTGGGEEIPQLSLKGNRVGGGLGFTYRLLSALAVDLSLQGSAGGNRKSLTTCFCAGWEF